MATIRYKDVTGDVAASPSYSSHRHPGVKRREEKPGMESFSECGAEGVQVDQCVGGDSVEGQGAGRAVYIYCHSFGGRGDRENFFSVFVPDRVTSVRALQTPGLMVSSKPTGSIVLPSDAPVSNTDGNPPCPLNLPIAASCQSRPTEQLNAAKSLRMIRVRLPLLHRGHLSFVVRQFEVRVCCVWIQIRFTPI